MTARRSNPTRIGLFAIIGLAVLVSAVVLVSGGRLFGSRERALMHFEGSIYGLQLGAPVVFRGVRLGSVVQIGVVHDAAHGGFAIPVTVELDRQLIRDLHGQPGGPSLQSLVDQGLSAQLSLQSLLTGLLYVDLDLRPGVPRPAAAHGASEWTEIPTVTAPIQALQKQIQGLNVARLVDDVSSLAAAARQLLADPKLRQSLDQLAQASEQAQRLLARVDRRVDPLADALAGALAETRRTGAAWTSTAERTAALADRLGGTVDRADAVLAQGAPALQSVQRAADELARAATTLRAATGDESAWLLQLERAAHDVSRASRAVRDLADLLERQPEVLIRGRSASP